MWNKTTIKKTELPPTGQKRKRGVSKSKVCSVCIKAKEGSFSLKKTKKKVKEEEEEEKKVWPLPTYHPPSPGRDVVAELPFDGAFRGFSCHYAVSKLHLMLVHSPEIRHLIEKTFALACWATCSPLHTIWNHG